MPVNKLTIESSTQTAAHVGSGVAVGGITGDYTIKLLVKSFALPGASARIAIEEATSNAFTPAQQLVVWNFNAGTLPTEGIVVSFRKYMAAGTDVVGEAGSFVRLNLQELNGAPTLLSITYDAWIEY